MNLKKLILSIVLIFFVSNAIFWGLFSHEAHCNLIKYISQLSNITISCPSHQLHILWGFVCYSISVYISQSVSLF